MSAPLGRRPCRVIENRATGGYRLFSLLDTEGPEPLPGQFYMLAAEHHWEERGQRPFLPRALSVADTSTCPFVPDSETNEQVDGRRLDFLVEGIGPGTDRLCELEPGESVWLNGPLGNSFSTPRNLHQVLNEIDGKVDAGRGSGAILVGGGIGIAPLALLRHAFAAKNIPTRVLLGFRDEEHSGGIDELFSCCEVRLASDDGHVGHHGYVTDLLAQMLEGDDAGTAAVYACGPPAMLNSVGAMCLDASVPCELAMESPMACGYGACYGCAVPDSNGGFARLCVDGPVVRGGRRGSSQGRGVLFFAPTSLADSQPSLQAKDPAPGGRPPATPSPFGAEADFCGLKLAHPVINASGTFDAIAAHKVYGNELLERFPFSAFVSKTITPEPRAGNEPQRLWETPAGMINSIGLPNKGLDGFLAQDLPQLAELPVPLVVSVMGTSHEEFAKLVRDVGERDEVAAIELNVSCPNVHSGLIVGEQPSETETLVEALRPLTEKPLIVKLTPNVANPTDVAVAAEQGGADAVSLINTLKASAVDPATGRPGIVAGHGGLSGPAVRPIAIAQLRAVAAAVTVPIVGMGGIGCGADAAEFLQAGAALVAVGTESFRDPLAGSRIASELSNDQKSRSGSLIAARD